MNRNRRKTKKVILVCGTRPNFMKVAPIWEKMKEFPEMYNPLVLHTGQHYDANMSGLFFRDLKLPKPNVYLGVGSSSHAIQTAKVMVEFEKILARESPNLIIVVGDVNSTIACSIVASKLLIPVAHIEAGLRSFDRTMPEEINRVIVDHLSNFLFTTCKDADDNLKREGIPEERIFFVGNVMIDSLVKSRFRAKKSKVLEILGVDKKNYAVLTLHRPSNVDNRKILQKIFEAIDKVSERILVVFPVHPRTVKQIRKFGIKIVSKNIKLIKPLGYIDFLQLCINSKFVLTDSGGIQEETTYLKIPCLTLRKNTERPITVKEGSNKLVGIDKEGIVEQSLKIIMGKHKTGGIPALWDGHAATRIVKILGKSLKRKSTVFFNERYL